jgi:hypothetical protein
LFSPSLNLELVWRIFALLAFFQCFRRGLCDLFVEYIESCDFLSRFQSGFRRFHSTATVFTSIMDDIHLSVERSGFLVAVLLDFSKAFDSMVHDVLLWKLRVKFGLSSTACKLFGSFLGQRAQKVMVDGEFSDVASVEMGSPQGSVLSPILFACFFNVNFTCMRMTLEGMWILWFVLLMRIWKGFVVGLSTNLWCSMCLRRRRCLSAGETVVLL